MKKYLLTIGICLLFINVSLGQSAGDIAFVGLNVDGDDDFAIVALADLPNVSIFFTDDEWNGTALNGSEGTLTWVTGGTIPAGTIVIFTDVDSNSNPSFGVSTGTLSSSGSFNLSGTGDALWAYIGTSGSPTTFLAAISNEDAEFNGTTGTTTGTGLTLGTHALDLSQGSGTPDGGIYSGVRQALDKTAFLSLVGNLTNNWTILGSSGDGETQLPFSTTAFEFTNTVSITGTAGWRLLSLPKTSATVSDISDDTAIQGVAGGSDTGAAANVYTYDDTGAYEVPTNVSTTIPNGYGLAVYFYNNTTNGSSTLPVVLDVSGTEPSTAIVTNLYSGATGRYTLVGNPYATNYNLNNSTADGAIGSNVSFWDNTAGSFVTQSATADGGFIVSPYQGFFVVTGSGSTTTYTFNTAGKTTTPKGGSYFKSNSLSTNADIEFSISSSYNTDMNLKIQVRDEAVQGWDNWDLPKLNSLLYYNVSGAFKGTLEGEEIAKAIESVPSALTEEITIPLTVSLIGETQEVTMSWKGLSDIPANWDVVLKDYELGTSINLREVSEYSFTQIAEAGAQKAKSLLSPGLGETMKLKSTDTNRFGITITPSTTVSNEDELTTVEKFRLEQNYPNPFNPSTTIKYAVGQSGPVNITVYNVMGQKVAELLNTTKNAGSYQITWDATAQSSGIYYYRLTAPGQVLTRQMTLIK